MITVICFKWQQPNYRSTFLPDHVHALEKMVKTHLDISHRFVCITDDSKDLECGVFPLWDFPTINLPQGRTNAYRCLKLFSEEAKDWFRTDRILVLDLDTVITNDITPLVDTNDDFAIWADCSPRTHYNSSMWVLNLGTRTQVWDTFTTDAPKITRQKGIIGSDQAWISHVLGPGEKTWDQKDGLYSYRFDLKEGTNPLPSNARAVFFHGKFDPWDYDTQQRSPWIKTHWQGSI